MSTPQATEHTVDGSGGMFDEIAHRYDLLNRLISLGMDQGWRRRTVDALELSPGHRVLDVATGTADLALMIAKREPGARVLGLDPSSRMLEQGRAKVTRAGLDDRIELCQGDAQELPFENHSFDAACMAFGIRNVPDRPQALRELRRVLAPGARLAILELSEPPPGLLGSFARLHVHHIVPWLGSLLSGSREYRYLQESIAAFPPASDFTRTLEECGFEVLQVLPMSFGSVNLYVGTPRREASA